MVFGIGEGKIDIILEKNNFKPGDTIRGRYSSNSTVQRKRANFV